MDKTYITFDVRSTSESKTLGVDVIFDNQLVYNNDYLKGTDSVKFEIPEDNSAHSLKIILKNKTSDHTVLDHLGAVVQDSTVIVDNLRFDEIPVGHNVLQYFVYTHDCNGTDQLKEHKFYGEMGCNGTVELKFTTPIYLWLLENM